MPQQNVAQNALAGTKTTAFSSKIFHSSNKECTKTALDRPYAKDICEKSSSIFYSLSDIFSTREVLEKQRGVRRSGGSWQLVCIVFKLFTSKDTACCVIHGAIYHWNVTVAKFAWIDSPNPVIVSLPYYRSHCDSCFKKSLALYRTQCDNARSTGIIASNEACVRGPPHSPSASHPIRSAHCFNSPLLQQQ